MSARTWAETVTEPVPWSQLEVEAFAGHPDIREVLEFVGRGGRARGRTLRQLVRAVPVVTLQSLAFLGPIVGFAILVDGKGGRADVDPAFALPLGGALFGVGLVGLLVLGVTWLADRWRWSPPRGAYPGTLLVLGLFSTLAAAARATEVPGGSGWVVLVAATTLLALALSVVALRSYRGRDRGTPSGTGAESLVARLTRLDELVAELTPAERADVRADIADAIAVLRRRGLMSPESARRATSARLGHLAVALAPRP